MGLGRELGQSQPFRFSALSVGWLAPRSYASGLPAHFPPGDIVDGSIGATTSDFYRSGQLASWGRVDWGWAHAMRPWCVPRPWKIVPTPQIIARLTLLPDGAFDKHPNAKLLYSARLSVPELDSPHRSDMDAMAGAAHSGRIRRSPRKSLIGDHSG